MMKDGARLVNAQYGRGGLRVNPLNAPHILVVADFKTGGEGAGAVVGVPAAAAWNVALRASVNIAGLCVIVG